VQLFVNSSFLQTLILATTATGYALCPVALADISSALKTLNYEEGQDFDMAYLGMKIASHAAALAELQAIQNVGSQEFQQLVRTAEKKTSDHLERAKELANNLKDKKDR
jgi:predicted outer membrane protein